MHIISTNMMNGVIPPKLWDQLRTDNPIDEVIPQTKHHINELTDVLVLKMLCKI
jgi:hypothetical protein